MSDPSRRYTGEHVLVDQGLPGRIVRVSVIDNGYVYDVKPDQAGAEIQRNIPEHDLSTRADHDPDPYPENPIPSKE